jgi:hypothetical protein
LPGAVQRRHQPSPRPLAQRLGGHQQAQPRNQVGVVAEK